MRATYDPKCDRITLPPDASVYALAHENAHRAQREARTLLWRLHEIAGTWPFVARPLRVLVEWQAARLALAVLQRLGRCSKATRREARAGLWSYVRACFWP